MLAAAAIKMRYSKSFFHEYVPESGYVTLIVSIRSGTHSNLWRLFTSNSVLIAFGAIMEVFSRLVSDGGHKDTLAEHMNRGLASFDSQVFFFLLLPPIILESAYALHDKVFLENICTILLFAIVGTSINIGLIGVCLWAINYTPWYYGPGINNPLWIPAFECFLFSTIVSAVDPVAVLAILKSLDVHSTLYFLVLGDSLLNDVSKLYINVLI